MCASRPAISRWVRLLPLAAVISGTWSVVPSPLAGGAEIPVAKTQKAEKPQKAPWRMPFGAADAVQYFISALEARPTVTREGHTVFENPKGATPEDQYRILILQEENDVVLHFSVGGDYGMNLAREFFESPLFKRHESEQLYALLNEAAKAPVMSMERFSVSARLWETPDRVHLVLRFFHPKSPIVL